MAEVWFLRVLRTHSMQALNALIKFNKCFLQEKEAPKHPAMCMKKNQNQQLNWDPASKAVWALKEYIKRKENREQQLKQLNVLYYWTTPAQNSEPRLIFPSQHLILLQDLQVATVPNTAVAWSY